MRDDPARPAPHGGVPTRPAGQETAYVRCPHCSLAFPSPLQVDRATLEALVPVVDAVCPHCGHEAPFRKADHWFELPAEPPGPSEP